MPISVDQVMQIAAANPMPPGPRPTSSTMAWWKIAILVLLAICSVASVVVIVALLLN